MPCTRHIVHHRVARLPSPRGVITLHIPPPCRLNVFRHVRGSRRARWLRGPPFKSSTIFTMARVPTERERERERREKEREFSIGRRSLRLRKKRRINRQTFPTKRKKLLEGVVHTFSFQFFRDSSFQIHFPLVVLQSSSLLSTDLSNFVIPLSRQRF